jgi:phosphonate dehydrogenase
MLPDSQARLASFCHAVINQGDMPWTADELRRRAASEEADAIIAFMPDRIDAALIAACPRLRCIAGALKGADNIDLAACRERGIAVSVVADLLSDPTAELGVALALALLRRVRDGDLLVRAGHDGWRPHLYGGSLVGAAVGILGMGGVGRSLVRLLGGFGCRIFYHDPQRLDSGQERQLGLSWGSSDELLACGASVLFLACPLSDSSMRWLDAARLSRLAAGTVVVNIGRGSVVDEAAVLHALREGRLAGYGADVFAFEDRSLPDRPLSVDHRLLAHPRTCFTPHLGSAVASVRLAIERAAIDSVFRHLVAPCTMAAC